MNPSLQIGQWLLTPASNRLVRGDTTHVLRPKLVQLLVCLAEEPGRVFERDELLERVWPGIVVTDDSVTRGISELRKRLGDSADAPRYIETIRKGGYRLIAPVSRVQDQPVRMLSIRSHRARPLAIAAAGIMLALALFLREPIREDSAPLPARIVEPSPLHHSRGP